MCRALFTNKYEVSSCRTAVSVANTSVASSQSGFTSPAQRWHHRELGFRRRPIGGISTLCFRRQYGPSPQGPVLPSRVFASRGGFQSPIHLWHHHEMGFHLRHNGGIITLCFRRQYGPSPQGAVLSSRVFASGSGFPSPIRRWHHHKMGFHRRHKALLRTLHSDTSFDTSFFGHSSSRTGFVAGKSVVFGFIAEDVWFRC